MIFRIGQAIELAAVFKADRDVAGASQLDDFFDPSILSAARDENAIERAARVQSLADSVDAGELVHEGNSLQSSVDSRQLKEKRRCGAILELKACAGHAQ